MEILVLRIKKQLKKEVIKMSRYEEPLRIAKEIYYRLEQAEEELRSSKKWGIADLFLKNMWIGGLKRNRMNDADYFLNRVEQLTVQLQKELEEIRIDFKNDILQSDRGKILDILFDNIFSDFSAQRRITKALEQIQNYKPKIAQIVQFLEKEILLSN